MNWSVLRLLYIHEMRMLLRARRTVIMAIVLPAIIMPLMLYAQKYSADRRERLLTGTIYRYALREDFGNLGGHLINKTGKGRGAPQTAASERLRNSDLGRPAPPKSRAGR